MEEKGTPVAPHSRKKHRLLLWIGLPILLVILALAITAEILLHRAEPMLRARVVDTLSTRFHSRVELGKFDVSLLQGLKVSGKNLAIYPYNLETSQPTLAIGSFSFRTTYSNLLRTPMKIGHVEVRGLRINLPPKSQRKQLPHVSAGKGGGIKIFVNEIHTVDTVLTLGTDKPGKVPLEFDIQNLVLKSVGAGQPLHFVATLTNPKPVGNIHSTGSFGPWDSDDPGSSPVSGTYSFSHADLGTLKGIGGILSSQGRYQGSLDRIVVDGETDTPDFEVKVSGHKVPLHTDFHAIVDGTNGDTYLQPVVAHLLHSSFSASGYVVRQPGIPGHYIFLDVTMDQARIEDLLRLGVRTDPPVMDGQVKMHTKLVIPPGPQDIAQKLQLQGNFQILNAHFTNPKVQSKVDELSLRGEGQPKLAKAESQDPNTANVSSQMSGNFRLANGRLTITGLKYDVPGANINLNGVYSLDGNKFDFHGTARLKATVSQIVGGWKGILLKPIDRFFQKNGAGTEVPIKITGTRSEPHFGLDFGHKNDQQQK